MRLHKGKMGLIAVALLAGCSFGPRFQTSMPQVRDVPVLANLSPRESLARGRSFLASKQYGLAIELFKGASRDPALKAESLNGLAIAYDAIGRRDLAERYFQRALAANPSDGRVRRNLAALYASIGQQDKERELLANPAEPKPSRRVAIAAVGLPPMPRPKVATLEQRSPLGGIFEPLLVKAVGQVPNVTASSASAVIAPSDDTTIMCISKSGESLSAGGDTPLQIFRINMGAVFIAAKPVGATCFADDGELAARFSGNTATMSNKEYLGLIAAYLERLNEGDTGAVDIAILWRAAFWHDGEA